ncbi:MAG: RuBisCO large subunit C-terminal-like domain-containing protein [Pseudomonadota bacterium]
MEQFHVTYEIRADSQEEAEDWARAVAREQTIECIDEAVPHEWIFDEVLGKVEHVEAVDEGCFSARVAYNGAVTGDELPQLLNMVYGNSSLHVGVKFTGLSLPPAMQRFVPGPRYGIEGVRAETCRANGPLICAVIKPTGMSPAEMAEIAYQCALGGADLIKDDHNLAMQPWAPFEPRVEAIAAAVARANAETGRRTLYAPSMNAAYDQFMARARFAVEVGAGAFLVMPALTGWDSLRLLAADPDTQLPIMAHPAGLGTYANAPGNGIAHPVLYATYPRLAGADVSIYPSFGGRYGFSRELCVQIAEACRDPDGLFKPILPSPGGGMRLDLAAKLRGMYGDDAVFLFGGSAMRYRDKIASGLREIRAALSAPA